ncbi:hypothetical protein BH09PAT1_BH09PAT1_5030 [soil metagenome]
MAKKKSIKLQSPSTRSLKLSLLSGFLFVIILGTIYGLHQTPSKNAIVSTPTVLPPQAKIAADIFRYPGKEGVDALTLIKQITSVEQDNSGLVTSINKRKADSSKREYWSFFVNDKVAEVGPADYVTKDTDLIEWKIQTY